MVSAKRRTREEDFTIKQGGTERQGTGKKIFAHELLSKSRKKLQLGWSTSDTYRLSPQWG
jgi:hypothetical protein